MAAATICEFLGSSTIHGLVHISTAKSKAARAAWVVIVVVSFAFAISMITNAYLEWHESPVSTTITTHPITELGFPAVTVCPPRGSNTAVNHLLEKVKYINYTKEERQRLLNVSRKVFFETPTKVHAEQMVELLSGGNMRSIVNEQASVPEIGQSGLITIRSSELEGSFSTPGFGDPEYRGEFYSTHRSFHYVLDLPDSTGEIVGKGVFVVSVDTEGDWSFISPENRLHLSEEQSTWLEAEDLCVSKGSHLASVGSQRENDEIERLASGKWVSLAARREKGRRKEEGQTFEWLDGRPWEYQNWGPGEPSKRFRQNCLWVKDGTWISSGCNLVVPYPICANPPTRRLGNHTLVTKAWSPKRIH